MTLADLLFAAAPDEDAAAVLVHVGAASWSRAEVRRSAEALAVALSVAGIDEGRPVGVMLPNGIGPIAALFGVWHAGTVYVPLNPRLTDDEVDHILASVEPAAVVTTPELASRFPAGGARPALIVAGEGGTWAAVDPPSGAAARAGPAASDPATGRVHDADVALIQFTSGTTGRPKPVLLLHSGVLTLLDGVLAKLRPGGAAGSAGSGSTGAPGERPAPMPNLIPVSLSLWAGIYNVLFALRVGAPVVVMEGFDPAEFAEVVARFGIRSTVLPPAAMTMLADDDAITDLAPLRFVRSITAPLSPLQARRFRDKFGIAVLNSYGQTEIGGEIVGWNAADSRAHGEAKLGSVGRPHEGVELRVIGADGTDLDADQAGELWVRTPALSAGYADGSDLSDRLAPGGWFRTGDVARVDADGFVWIEGRVSSMINRGGLKVYPGEVEEVLRLHPSVGDVAVIGVPDDRLGEVPWAFVVARGVAPADGAGWAAELTATCRDHLAPYKVPVQFVPIDELPRNEVGKVLAHDLLARTTGSTRGAAG